MVGYWEFPSTARINAYPLRFLYFLILLVNSGFTAYCLIVLDINADSYFRQIVTVALTIFGLGSSSLSCFLSLSFFTNTQPSQEPGLGAYLIQRWNSAVYFHNLMFNSFCHLASGFIGMAWTIKNPSHDQLWKVLMSFLAPMVLAAILFVPPHVERRDAELKMTPQGDHGATQLLNGEKYSLWLCKVFDSNICTGRNIYLNTVLHFLVFSIGIIMSLVVVFNEMRETSDHYNNVYIGNILLAVVLALLVIFSGSWAFMIVSDRTNAAQDLTPMVFVLQAAIVNIAITNLILVIHDLVW